MSMYEKLNQTMQDRDVNAYLNLLHDEFTVVFHKSGNSFTKNEWSELVREMMANEKFIQESSRCVYENEDILVEHSFMSYPDNTRGVMYWRCYEWKSYKNGDWRNSLID